MGIASRAAVEALQNQKSLKYGDFDVTRDWAYASNPLRGQGANYVLFNTKDPSQKFASSMGSDEQLHNFGLNIVDGFSNLSKYGFDVGDGNRDAVSKVFGVPTIEKQAEQKYQQGLIDKYQAGEITREQINSMVNQSPGFTDPGSTIYNNAYNQAKTGQVNQPPVSNQLGAIGTSNTVMPNDNLPTGSANNLANQYQALLGQSPEEQAAQKALDDQQTASRQGEFNVSQQPIAQSFISGQQAAMQTQSDLSKIPLEQKLAREQERRRASLDSVKFQLERADKAAADKKAENKLTEVSPGASLYNPKTKESVFTAPTAAQTTSSKTLDTSNTNAIKLFQQTNGLVADGIVGPKTLAKMSELGISPTGKTTTKSTSTNSSGIKYTPTQTQTLKQAGVDANDKNSATFFLNTDKAFQDFWAREAAGSPSNQTYSVQELMKYYDNWVKNIKNGGSAKRSA